MNVALMIGAIGACFVIIVLLLARRTPAPDPRVTHYTPRKYLESRSAGRGVVRPDERG